MTTSAVKITLMRNFDSENTYGTIFRATGTLPTMVNYLIPEVITCITILVQMIAMFFD